MPYRVFYAEMKVTVGIGRAPAEPQISKRCLPFAHNFFLARKQVVLYQTNSSLLLRKNEFLLL